MSEQGMESEGPTESLPTGELGTSDAASEAQTGAGDGSASSPRRFPTIAAVAVLAVLTAAAAGAALGHEYWTTSRLATGLPTGGTSANNPFPNLPSGNGGLRGSGIFGNSRSVGGSSATASGAPADATSIASRVDPGLVDVNSSFGYQGSGGAGTGIVISSSGEVLTNNHVIDGATQITARDVGNGKTYTATVVGYDPSHDLAVLQLQGATGLTTAKLGNSSNLSVGAGVIGIGNAGGTGGTPSSAAGSITGLNQSVTAGDEFGGTSEQLSGLIETNAGIQPGDSGGPLVNSSGQVIGIDTAGSVGFDFPSANGQAFAIPINEAAQTALQIVSNHPASTTHVGPSAFLGVSVGQPNGSGDGFGFSGFGNGAGANGPTASGVEIAGVLNGDPAQKAGLAAGDVITSLNGTSVGSRTALSRLMLGHHPGDLVRLGWTDTSGKAHSATLQLARGPAS
jgi:S1-C subfamily serine protease